MNEVCGCPFRKPKVGDMFHTTGATSLWLVLHIDRTGRTHAAVRYSSEWKYDTAVNGNERYYIIEGEDHGHTFYD